MVATKKLRGSNGSIAGRSYFSHVFSIKKGARVWETSKFALSSRVYALTFLKSDSVACRAEFNRNYASFFNSIQLEG